MCWDDLCVVLFVDSYLDVSLVLIRGGEDGNVWVRTHSANALGVETGVYGVDQAQVSKVVHIDSVFKHNDNPNN